MVKEVNFIPVDVTDHHGFVDLMDLDIIRSTTSAIVDDQWRTYKHVDLSLRSTDPDGPSFAISLSPLRALLLVKRLLRVLDGLTREGVVLPQLHSMFMNDYDEVSDLTMMDPIYREFIRDIVESKFICDGELLRDILPQPLKG